MDVPIVMTDSEKTQSSNEWRTYTERNLIRTHYSRVIRGCVIDTYGNCRLQNDILGLPCSMDVGLACSDHPFLNDVLLNDLRCMYSFNKVNS